MTIPWGESAPKKKAPAGCAGALVSGYCFARRLAAVAEQ